MLAFDANPEREQVDAVREEEQPHQQHRDVSVARDPLPDPHEHLNGVDDDPKYPLLDRAADREDHCGDGQHIRYRVAYRTIAADEMQDGRKRQHADNAARRQQEASAQRKARSHDAFLRHLRLVATPREKSREHHDEVVDVEREVPEELVLKRYVGIERTVDYAEDEAGDLALSGENRIKHARQRRRYAERGVLPVERKPQDRREAEDEPRDFGRTPRPELLEEKFLDVDFHD